MHRIAGDGSQDCIKHFALAKPQSKCRSQGIDDKPWGGSVFDLPKRLPVNQQQPLQQAPYGDEIDLFELFQGLWAQKVLIVLIAALCGLLSGAYVFLTEPTYEAQAMLRPAPIKGLDELNAMGVLTLSPEEALNRVGAALGSYEVRQQFFRKNEPLFEVLASDSITVEQVFRSLIKDDLQVLQPDPKQKDQQFEAFVGLKLQYPESLAGADIVNGLIEQAITSENERIKADLAVVVKNKLASIERSASEARAGYQANKQAKIAQLMESDVLQRANLQDELKALRAELRLRRLSRITQLDEAIRIAKELGIKKPTTPSAMDQVKASGSGNTIRTEVFNQQFPLYFMGAEALEAERTVLRQRRSDDHTEPRIAKIQKELQLLEHNREIETLKARQDDDLFLKQLEALRTEEARLKGLSIDMKGVQLVVVDQPAITPQDPIKPKKVLVLVLGLVLGGMLGVFIALIRNLIGKRKAAQI